MLSECYYDMFAERAQGPLKAMRKRPWDPSQELVIDSRVGTPSKAPWKK